MTEKGSYSRRMLQLTFGKNTGRPCGYRRWRLGGMQTNWAREHRTERMCATNEQDSVKRRRAQGSCWIAVCLSASARALPDSSTMQGKSCLGQILS